MGFNTTPLTEQSFQILAESSRVYRKRKGSSGRVEGKSGDQFPSNPYEGKKDCPPLEVVVKDTSAQDSA